MTTNSMIPNLREELTRQLDNHNLSAFCTQYSQLSFSANYFTCTAY